MKNQHRTVLTTLAAFVAAGVFGPLWAAQQNGADATAAASSQVTYDLSQLDTKPQAKVRTPPQYPYALRSKGVQGEAVVECVVTAQGEVTGVTVIRCTDPLFGEAAVAAVSQWKFNPGMKGGVPVATRMQVPIAFSLNSKS